MAYNPYRDESDTRGKLALTGAANATTAGGRFRRWFDETRRDTRRFGKSGKGYAGKLSNTSKSFWGKSTSLKSADELWEAVGQAAKSAPKGSEAERTILEAEKVLRQMGREGWLRHPEGREAVKQLLSRVDDTVKAASTGAEAQMTQASEALAKANELVTKASNSATKAEGALGAARQAARDLAGRVGGLTAESIRAKGVPGMKPLVNAGKARFVGRASGPAVKVSTGLAVYDPAVAEAGIRSVQADALSGVESGLKGAQRQATASNKALGVTTARAQRAQAAASEAAKAVEGAKALGTRAGNLGKAVDRAVSQAPAKGLVGKAAPVLNKGLGVVALGMEGKDTADAITAAGQRASETIHYDPAAAEQFDATDERISSVEDALKSRGILVQSPDSTPQNPVWVAADDKYAPVVEKLNRMRVDNNHQRDLYRRRFSMDAKAEDTLAANQRVSGLLTGKPGAMKGRNVWGAAEDVMRQASMGQNLNAFEYAKQRSEQEMADARKTQAATDATRQSFGLTFENIAKGVNGDQSLDPAVREAFSKLYAQKVADSKAQAGKAATGGGGFLSRLFNGQDGAVSGPSRDVLAASALKEAFQQVYADKAARGEFAGADDGDLPGNETPEIRASTAAKTALARYANPGMNEDQAVAAQLKRREDWMAQNRASNAARGALSDDELGALMTELGLKGGPEQAPAGLPAAGEQKADTESKAAAEAAAVNPNVEEDNNANMGMGRFWDDKNKKWLSASEVVGLPSQHPLQAALSLRKMQNIQFTRAMGNPNFRNHPERAAAAARAYGGSGQIQWGGEQADPTGLSAGTIGVLGGRGGFVGQAAGGAGGQGGIGPVTSYLTNQRIALLQNTQAEREASAFDSYMRQQLNAQVRAGRSDDAKRTRDILSYTNRVGGAMMRQFDATLAATIMSRVPEGDRASPQVLAQAKDFAAAARSYVESAPTPQEKMRRLHTAFSASQDVRDSDDPIKALGEAYGEVKKNRGDFGAGYSSWSTARAAAKAGTPAPGAPVPGTPKPANGGLGAAPATPAPAAPAGGLGHKAPTTPAPNPVAPKPPPAVASYAQPEDEYLKRSRGLSGSYLA